MPANENYDTKYQATSWGKSQEELTCPSGQTCLVRPVDIRSLMAEGILTKLDVLTQLVETKHVSKKAKGGQNSKKSQEMTDAVIMKKLMADPEKLKEALLTVDKVVIATVIAPKLYPTVNDDGQEIEWTERIDGLVYIDTVALPDKMFLMNHAFGGTKEVARFHGEIEQLVGTMADVENVEQKPQ